MEKIVERFVEESLMDFKIEIPRTLGFNGNNLPLCPRQAMLDYINPKKHYSTVPFQTRYNYHVNRAISSLVRELWAKQSLLWGDFQCSDPKCAVRFNNTRLQKGQCIRCGEPCDYLDKKMADIEIGYEGILDGVVFIESLKGYLVFKLKSRNKNVIATSDAPYAGDLYEISIHASILTRKFGLPIVGRTILWIGKPKPKPYKLWHYDGIGEKLTNEMFEVKRKLLNQIEKGEFLSVEGLCLQANDVENMNCPFGEICLSENREALISNQVKDFFKNGTKNF